MGVSGVKPVSGMAVRRLTLALIALTAGGCTAPQLAAPQSTLPVPADWAESDPAPISVDIAEYWRLLNDPLLTELVERSITENRNLAQSAARLDQARSQLAQARAGYLPSVTASAGSGRDLGTGNPGRNSFSIGADAQWEADLFGRVSSNVAASQADLVAAGYSLADLQRAIVGQVAISTVQARAIALQLQIARDTLAFQEDNLQIARWRNQAGLVDSLDVEQARTQRAQTAASIPQLESNLVAVANAISTLIGEPPGSVYRALTEAPRAVPAPPADFALAAPADMLRRRPDVSAAEARLAADLDRIGIARAQLYPLARLSGTIGTSAANIGNLFDLVAGNVFASLSQLIFDGGRARGQIEGAQANADGSLIAWRQSILVALQEVESAGVDLETSVERVAALAEASDGAQNAVLLARSQYQAGLIDFQTLLVAESQLLNTRTAEVNAQGGRALAFIALARAMGGGWSVPDGAGLEDIAAKGPAK